MKEISIIVVNYNTTELVRKLEAKFSCKHIEFIVVDNSSNYIKKHDKTILISGCGNVGFGRACNLGADSSTKSDLLFLNPDAELSQESLNILINYPKKQMDIIGPIIYEKGKDVSLLFDCKIPFFVYGRKKINIKDMNDVHDTLFVSGACMLINRDNFKRLGGFDESVFLYAEDLDICIRNSLQGGGSFYIKKATSNHIGGKSSVTHFQLIGKFKRLKNSYDGHYLILRKNHSPIKSFINALYLASGITI